MQATTEIKPASQTAPVVRQQAKPVIVSGSFTQQAAYDQFRGTGFANGRDIVPRELTCAVRSNEFIIKSAPGKALGKRVYCDGQVYTVPDIEVEINGKRERLREAANAAIVLSFSHLRFVPKGDGTHVEGDILKVLRVPSEDGWYKADKETAIPLAGMESTRADKYALYWCQRDNKPYVGAVVRGSLWNDEGRRRSVDVGCRLGGGFGVALASPAQAEHKLEQIATLLLRDAEEAEKSIGKLKEEGVDAPELLAPVERMIATARQLRIKG
jgi:hypothetical protein